MQTVQLHFFSAQPTLLNGETVEIPYAAVQGMLFYLAENGPESRDRLCALFWDEKDEKTAKKNLRNAIYTFRRIFGYSSLEDLPNDGVQIGPDCLIKSDLDLIRDQRGYDAETVRNLLDLYRNDFLSGFPIKRAELFQQWVMRRQPFYQKQYLQKLENAAEKAAAAGDLDLASQCYEKMIGIDSYNETCYQRLMEILLRRNRHQEALKVYTRLETMLREELMVQPSREVTDMIKEIVTTRSAKEPGTGFYGRKAELAELDACYSLFQSGHTRQGFLLTGEAGVGKTALLREWQRHLNPESIQIYVNNYRIEQDIPYKLWGNICSQIGTMGENGQLNLDREQVRLLRRLEMSPFDPDIPPHPDSQPGLSEQEAFVLRMMAYLSERREIILLIDDFQWVDRQSISLLMLVMAACPRVMIALSARTDEPGTDLTVQQAFLSKTRIRVFPLECFSLSETRAFVERIAPQYSRSYREIYRESEGNAFFITEIFHNLSAGLPINQMTPGINALISAHLEQLDRSVLAVANLIAVMQGNMTLRLLQIVAGGDVSDLVEALDTLMAQGILQEDVDERKNVCYNFTHQKLRDYIYASISRSKQILLHRRIAEGLERICAEHNESFLCVSQLIFHYTLADELYRVVCLRLDRQERIIKRRNEVFRIGVVRPVWGVDFEDDSAESTQEELEQIGRILDNPALMCSKKDLLTIRFRYAYLQGRYYYARGEKKEGAACMERMMRLARSSGDPAMLADAALRMVLLSIDEDDLDGVDRYAETCLKMQVVQDDPTLLAMVRHYQGVAELRRLNPDACVRLLRNNIETMKKLSGDYDMSVQIASDYYVLSTALLACRDLDGAENCIRLADESCREGQTPTSTAMLQLNSGILACLRGQYEEALKNLSQAETIYLQTDFWENKGLLYGYLTITADRLGQADLAARCRETCRKVLEETTNSLERRALREALGELEAGGDR